MTQKTPHPSTDTPSRADRLAANLRANLHRRKAQARAQATELATDGADATVTPDTLPKSSPSG